MPPRPWSARACDAFVLGYAAWTLVCHAVVLLAGGGFGVLLATGWLALFAPLAWWILGRRGARAAVPAAPGEDAAVPDGQLAGPPRGQLVGLAGALALAAALAAGAGVRLVWWLAVAWLAACLVAVLRAERGRGLARVAPARGGELLVWILSAAAAALPLVSHRASPDDGYYVNVAVHAVDHPEAPLLRFDTLHGVPDLPAMYSVYRLHSFELLGAALARLSGLSALEVFSWVLPVLFTLLLGLAHAQLARLLAPERWRWLFVVLLALLLLEAEVPQSFGSFAGFRMHQGKSALLFVALPLLVVHAAELARRPGARAWALLLATNVAAVGLSSTGLWLAPLVGGIAALGAARWSARGARALGLSLAAAAYPVAMGLLHVQESLDESAPLRDTGAGVQLVTTGNPVLTDGAELVAETWRLVLGEGALALLALVALLGAWATCRDGLARRLALAFPLALLLLLLDPYVALRIARWVTGPQTYWRVLWAVPLPALVALVLTARLAPGRLGRVLSIALPLALLPAVTGARGFREPIRWEPLGLEAHVEGLEHAEAIAREVPAGSHVLAPTYVGTCLLQLHGYSFPLVGQRNWLVVQEARLGGSEGERRLRLLDYVLGVPQPQTLLTSAIHDYDLRAVCFTRGTVNTKAIRSTLEFLGFRQIHASATWETWARPRA